MDVVVEMGLSKDFLTGSVEYLFLHHWRDRQSESLVDNLFNSSSSRFLCSEQSTGITIQIDK